ncbi:hypothetical protein Pmani_005825 [Petrolisthes manimaculis]|uniref:WD repeat-containing protein 34 n=1 Tax=Petrolisthes manimaculis TaxID=1843537 RepID=A0AAE1QBG6_9EUCA|nr:hypothetical protein Pmani_005825 [Petrolisthes manimaculis]
MFSKYKNSPQGFQSTWKTEQSLATDGTQTEELTTEDSECQVVQQSEAGTQTDEEKVDLQTQTQYDVDSLAAFLHRITPKVIKELERQNRSQAFAGYALRQEEEEEEGGGVRLLHTLRCKLIQPEMVVTGLAWSSTGSVIGVGYGANQHDDWCDHCGTLAVWNINRSDFDANQPERVIEMSSCVLCLAFHPNNPAVFAVGTFNGEVLVYDLSHSEDVTPMVTVECGGGAVTTLTWTDVGQAGTNNTTNTTTTTTSLVATTSTGYVLVWSFSITKQQLTLKTGFLVRSEDVPRVGRGSLNERSGLGITAASFNCEDSLLFLLGGVGGRLFICNAASETRTGVEYGGVELRACVSSTLSSHAGKVVAAEFSPYHRNAVITAASDDQIRLYTILQANKPVCSVHSQEGLTCARWSPYRPVVVAVGKVTGQVTLLDLSSKSTGEPLLTLPPPERPAPISTLQFNHKNVKLLSVGDHLGRVQIWQLPTSAVSPLPNERAILQTLLTSATAGD